MNKCIRCNEKLPVGQEKELFCVNCKADRAINIHNFKEKMNRKVVLKKKDDK